MACNDRISNVTNDSPAYFCFIINFCGFLRFKMRIMSHIGQQGKKHKE